MQQGETSGGRGTRFLKEEGRGYKEGGREAKWEAKKKGRGLWACEEAVSLERW